MRITLIGLFSLFMLAGCASGSRSSDAVAAKQPHAECTVCKANADLACVDIPVDGSTPTYLYQGKTYYFCSEECRAAFAKNPRKYAGP